MQNNTKNKYRLVRVDVNNQSWARPIDEHGRVVGNTVLLHFENTEDNYYYAIYENVGDENTPDWEEAEYFEQDFEKALEAYNNLREQTNKYELTAILRQDCDTRAERDRIHHQVTTYGGRVIKDECVWNKRLAYPVDGEDHADYWYFSIRLAKSKVVKLSTWLEKQNSVLRYLLVQDDNRED